MLVTTATKRMVDDIHGDAADAGPVRRGIPHLVVFVAGFHERFFDPSASRDDTNGSPATRIEPFCFAAGHSYTDPVRSLVNNDCLNAG
jgi:hypothetical protein